MLTLAVRNGKIQSNPATHLGELMRRVERRAAPEVETAESWTREEVQALLAIATQ